jgi:hypothetical protein
MKLMCSLAVLVMGVQSVCVGVCLGASPDAIPHIWFPLIGAPPCHGVTLPNNKDQSTKTDPCIERLAIKSRTLSEGRDLALAITGHEVLTALDQSLRLSASSVDIPFEYPALARGRLVLRI